MNMKSTLKRFVAGIWLSANHRTKKCAVKLKNGMQYIGKIIHRAAAAAIVHKEEMGYYAVLTLVLIALGAAANDYRNKKATQDILAALPTQDPGVSVQSKPDQTLPPEEESSYIMPVNGAIITAFSDTELNWSTTLQLWQTHPALDIAAAAGETVKAVANGTVTEAYSDALYGNVIVIEHEDGSQAKYSSLNTLKLVQVGQKVKQGDVISSVGTCDAEADLGAHIHLEYWVNGKQEDFSLLTDDAEFNDLQN